MAKTTKTTKTEYKGKFAVLEDGVIIDEYGQECGLLKDLHALFGDSLVDMTIALSVKEDLEIPDEIDADELLAD